MPIGGIGGNTARTPLDECGHVYKNLDSVLRVLESAGIARVTQRLYPVANITAGVRYMIATYGVDTLENGGRRSSSGGYVGY